MGRVNCVAGRKNQYLWRRFGREPAVVVTRRKTGDARFAGAGASAQYPQSDCCDSCHGAGNQRPVDVAETDDDMAGIIDTTDRLERWTRCFCPIYIL